MPFLEYIRSEPDLSESIQPFIHRLAEAIAWCDSRADPSQPATCLRNQDFRPRSLEASYRDSVIRVANSRRLHLGPNWRRPQSPAAQGSLMVYYPDADLCDGASQVETGGYLDAYNAPPWDTWIALIEECDQQSDRSYSNYLIAWVPPVFCPSVDRGINVNPEECIQWLDQAQNSPLRRIYQSLMSWHG